jgi:L-ascorbate metabolism protein UlaG (beta-lactamase superfamily)
MKVSYLGHSAWAVETENRYLLFDIQDENVKTGGLLADGFVDISLLNGKPVFTFFSHMHHDHYSRKLHTACNERADAFTFLGGFSAPGKRTVTMNPREHYEAGGVSVYTGASTDEGVCFLVEADGNRIFHAGDNADWGDGEQNKMYYGEIDYISSLGKKIDIAFIPVCTFSGQRPRDMTEGAIYAVQKLAPAVMYPMHANGRDYLYEEFEKDLKKQDKTHGTRLCIL